MNKQAKSLNVHWKNHTAQRAATLESIISDCKKKKMQFNHPTDLAKYAAGEMTRLLATDKPVNSSGLLRSKTYGPILKNFFEEPKAKSVLASEKLELELEIRSLRQDLVSAENQLSDALADRSRLENQAKNNKIHGGIQKNIESNFDAWEKIIKTLLKEIEGAYIDVPNRVIRDPIMKKVLLHASDFPAGFFEYLEKA
jgi:hypothetical protein